jgi:hypothetical protein
MEALLCKPKHTSDRMCEISNVSGAIMGFGWNNLYGDTGRLDCMWVYMGEREDSLSYRIDWHEWQK